MTKHMLPDVFGRQDIFSSLQREVDRVFSDFGRGLPTLRDAGWGNASLKMNVAETEKDVEVTAELPGVAPEQLNVEVRDGVLTIKGEKSAEKEDRKKNWHMMERSYGMFERAVALPVDVDEDKASATFEKGVLIIRLPKLPGSGEKTKRIEIRAA